MNRPKLFDEMPDPEDDLSRFMPRRAPAPVPLEQVRAVSAAAGFPTRDAAQPEPARRERLYFRTGRDTQFNTKVKRETKAAYNAIAREDGTPLGKVLEDALAALLREREATRR